MLRNSRKFSEYRIMKQISRPLAFREERRARGGKSPAAHTGGWRDTRVRFSEHISLLPSPFPAEILLQYKHTMNQAHL